MFKHEAHFCMIASPNEKLRFTALRLEMSSFDEGDKVRPLGEKVAVFNVPRIFLKKSISSSHIKIIFLSISFMLNNFPFS